MMINKTSEHKRLVRLMLNGTVAVLATFMGMGAVSMTEAHAVTEISVDMPETTPVHVNGKGADGLSIDEASVGDSKADAYPNKMTTNGYDHSIIKGDNTGTKVTTGFFLPGSVSKETAVSANGTLYPMNGAVEGMTTDSSNNLYILMKQPSSEDEYIMKFDASILTTLRSNPNILRQSQQYAQWKDNVKLVQNARAGKAGTNYKYQETVVKAVESVSGAKVTATSGLVTTPLQKWIAGGQISFSKLGLVPGNGTGSHGQGIVYDKKSGKIYVQVVGTTANKDINTLYSVSTDLKSDLTKFDFKTSTKTHLSAMTTDGTGNLYWETKWPSGGFYFYKGTVNKGEVTTITQLPVSFDTIFTNSTNQNMAYDSTTDRMYIIANSATLSFNWSNYLAACTAVSFGDKFGDSSLSYNVDQYKGTSEFEGMAFINGQNFVLVANPNQVLAAPVETPKKTTQTGYATVTKTGYPIYTSISGVTPSGTAVSATSDFNKTYKINGKYTMAGKTYYALVNYTSDKLIGYISTEAMPKITKSAGGSWLSKTGYATIKKSNYNTYSDFSWKIKTKASSNYQRTYKVNGMYHHANGSTYYSIYGGSSGKWYGYINANAATVTTVKQGAVMATSGYATVTKKYDVWGSFNWTKKLSAASAYQKTYQIKNKYSYCDGRTFYSLYNGKGTWIGYINGAGVKTSKNAQGTAIGASGKVKVVKHNYAIWSNFSWAKKSVTAAKSYNKTYTVKCYYNHVNGTKYDSVYSGSKWIGYINAAGVKSVK